jgi:carbon monoxide dehydrogenase subunit G
MMASQAFARDLRVTAAPERCWEVLTDVATLASWVTVLHDVEEHSRLDRYSVVLSDRLGPMKLKAKLDVRVEVPEEGREVRVSASGRDVQVNSAISVDATLRIEPGDDVTAVAVSGTYAVTGRVASMGGGIIRKKAEVILEEFFTEAGRALGAAGAQGAGDADAPGQSARDAGGIQ